jgi:hypothetical protein
MDHVSWSLGFFFQKPPLGSRPNTKPGDLIFYHVWRPAWIEAHWNSIWLRACDHTTWFWRCVGTAFGHFLLGSHNFMVTALGLCVKWPSVLESIVFPPTFEWELIVCMSLPTTSIYQHYWFWEERKNPTFCSYNYHHTLNILQRTSQHSNIRHMGL